MSDLPNIAAVLESLPRPAILLDRNYRILIANDQYRDVYGLSDRPGHRALCHEVSHGNDVPCDLVGESCPLRACVDTRQRSVALHIHHTPRGEEYVHVEMWPVPGPDGEPMFFIEQMHPSDIAATEPSHDRLVGKAPCFQAMLNLAERAAKSDVHLMLYGETGTGKDAVAQSVHEQSARRDKPFVPVECTGLPEALLEAELFGHKKGAFTGATTTRDGLVAAAEGGTLFLDEIGDVPLASQVKLLRLLETRRYRPLGTTDWREADFRLICATNKDLPALVETGDFREDLYYRLCVFEITLPPLRERAGDVPLLTHALCQRLGSPDATFTPAALQALDHYAFPGNIRELRNIVERAILLADGPQVDERHLPDRCRAQTPQTAEATAPSTLAEAEQAFLRNALATHTGTRHQLAAKLGVSERALYRKLATLRTNASTTPSSSR